MLVKPIKIVYLAHPFSDNPKHNLYKVTRIGEKIVELSMNKTSGEKILPIIPHLIMGIYHEVEQRGLRKYTELLSCRLVKACDELWLVSDNISKGMQLEIEAAKDIGIPIKDWMTIKKEMPQLAIVQLKSK